MEPGATSLMDQLSPYLSAAMASHRDGSPPPRFPLLCVPSFSDAPPLRMTHRSDGAPRPHTAGEPNGTIEPVRTLEPTAEPHRVSPHHFGLRVLHTIWSHRPAGARGELETVVTEAAATPDDPDSLAALRQHIKRALREDPDLHAELLTLLRSAPTPEPAPLNVTASGERSIAAHHIGTAVTGDHNTVRH
ncbi:hypothetical protein ACFWPV_01975 [Streptomyces uncialis]|uniref:hypothetical protein n=1 Tax=Streptomyces uncialis TaxID=1048205 RepID=UPI0036513B89